MRTLFQALVRFAEAEGLVEKPHHGMAKFYWQLDLHPDGSLASTELIPLTQDRQRGKTTGTDPYKELFVPRINRTRADEPMLGADDIAYVLGWPETLGQLPEEDEAAFQQRQIKAVAQAIQRHKVWTEMIRDWAAYATTRRDPIPGAILRFLEEHSGEVLKPTEWGSKQGVIVRVGGQLATDSPTAVPYWTSRVEAKKASGPEGLCLVCGNTQPLVETFPTQITGPLLPNGQSSGVAPVSINEIAYGYGLRKGLGQVPICMACAVSIVASLNKLLSDDAHRSRTPEAATVWWVEAEEQRNPILIIEDPEPEDVRVLLDSVRTGSRPESLDLDEFHSLVLLGNASRMVVQGWTHLPIRDLQDNLAAWFSDIEIESPWATGKRFQPLWGLAQATGRYDNSANRYLRVSDSAGHHPHGITEILRSVAIERQPVPRHVLTHLLQRISSDGRIDDPRAALLRLTLSRNPHGKESPMPGLDETNHQPSYLLGRLLSLYEDIQYKAATADGGKAPNATFADRYLAGAIISPRLVLTAGARQAVAWLTKLRKSGRDYYAKRQIDEIIDCLDPQNPGPVRASLEEQALFVLGYHHQRAFSSAQRQAASDRAAQASDADAQSNPNHQTQGE